MSNKKSLSLQEVQQLHRDGHLEQAKAGYLQLLAADADQVDVLHYLAILYAEESDFDNAEVLLEKAMILNASDLSLYLHLANVYKARKKHDDAVLLLQKALAINPKFSAAYNNLGTIYDAKNEWDAAISAYHAAIAIQPNYADAYYNLGLAFQKAKRFSEAMTTWQALLELAPLHFGAQFQLGRLYMQQNKYQQAIEQFYKIEKEYPEHFETQSNLATSFLKLGWLGHAKKHYLQALNVKPDDVQVLFNLGVIAMQQGSLREAIEFYTRVISVDVDFFEAYNNLGVTYLSMQNREKALQYFREALRMQPDNKAFQHTIDILAQDKQLSASPPEYVRSLFNSYAGHYDTHITETLHYDVPRQLYAAVSRQMNISHMDLDILDVGCGTGLCGELFKTKSNRLIGVDIAEKMLAVAAGKNIYQQLIHADIPDFLKEHPAAFDLIIAGDVVVYFGDLKELFADVYQALRLQGWFVFNAEMNVKNDYRMTESGRFAHSKAYLDRLLAEQHFTVVDYQVIHLRSQNNISQQGHLYLLKKL